MVRKLLLLVAVSLSAIGCSRKHPQGAAEAPSVSVSYALQRKVTDYAEYTGRTGAIKSVTIVPRVTGHLVKIPFKEGAEVKQGDLLFEIDRRPYQALVDQAKAQIALNQAQLQLAQTTYERDRAAREAVRDAVASQQVDQDRAAIAQADANVKATQATLAVQQLNLDFCEVTSPIDGRVSNYFLTLGNLAVQDQTRLTTVVSQDPMYGYFDADEPTVLQVRELIRKGLLHAVNEKGSRIPVYLGLSNEEGFQHEGYLDFVNNQFTPTSATLRVRGVFDNPKPEIGERLLSPGMFVRIRVPISPAHEAVLVSQDAIGTDQEVKFVYVLDEENKVVRRNVQLGTLHEGLQEIMEGVEPGERVIVSGVQHVRAGTVVSPRLVTMAAPRKGELPRTPPTKLQTPPGPKPKP